MPGFSFGEAVLHSRKNIIFRVAETFVEMPAPCSGFGQSSEPLFLYLKIGTAALALHNHQAGHKPVREASGPILSTELVHSNCPRHHDVAEWHLSKKSTSVLPSFPPWQKHGSHFWLGVHLMVASEKWMGGDDATMRPRSPAFRCVPGGLKGELRYFLSCPNHFSQNLLLANEHTVNL